MSENQEVSIPDIEWFIFSGSRSDLSRLDFSSQNLRFLSICSDELKEICTEYSDTDSDERTWDILQDIANECPQIEKEKIFVLLPIDINCEVSQESYWQCWRVLLIMFPSDIDIYSEITLQYVKGSILHTSVWSTYPFYSSGINYLEENFLFFADSQLAEINDFINLFFQRFSGLKYVHSAVYSYCNSFSQHRLEMAYLGYCISLESVVKETNELTYRIARNIAILCGEDELHSNRIFKNFKKIYTLRSKIAHSGDYNLITGKKYLPYIKNLVSRLLIEVILHNITDLDELNEKLTSIGFGDKQKISTTYESKLINPSSYANVYTTELSNK